MDKQLRSDSKIIGWREWVGLPLLGIDALKAKIDTGAKTSTLHAFDIELLKQKDQTLVRFKVHPLQDDLKYEVTCLAPLVDRREITDSGGHKEERIVIRTTLVIAGIKRKIDVTLTNRQKMKYRMLIGRSALKSFYIDPSQSFLCGRTLKQRRFIREIKKSINV